MAGMTKAGVLQRLLLDRVGDQAGDRSGQSKACRTFDRFQGRGGIGRVGLAWNCGFGQPDGQDGKGACKDVGCLVRRRDLAQGHIEVQSRRQRGQPRRIVEREKGTACICRPCPLYLPHFEAEFAADTGRLAHGDGERQGTGHDLTSIVAWRRRSRM